MCSNRATRGQRCEEGGRGWRAKRVWGQSCDAEPRDSRNFANQRLQSSHRIIKCMYRASIKAKTSLRFLATREIGDYDAALRGGTSTIHGERIANDLPVRTSLRTPPGSWCGYWLPEASRGRRAAHSLCHAWLTLPTRRAPHACYANAVRSLAAGSARRRKLR